LKLTVNRIWLQAAGLAVFVLAVQQGLFAQTVGADPLSRMTANFSTTIIGPVAQRVALAFTAITGMVYMASEGSGKRMAGGMAIGGAIALGAQQIGNWLWT
jgi:type IV secretory pathway VirB2 component (pilin)